jgi:hypothetical protein
VKENFPKESTNLDIGSTKKVIKIINKTSRGSKFLKAY